MKPDNAIISALTRIAQSCRTAYGSSQQAIGWRLTGNVAERARAQLVGLGDATVRAAISAVDALKYGQRGRPERGALLAATLPARGLPGPAESARTGHSHQLMVSEASSRTKDVWYS